MSDVEQERVRPVLRPAPSQYGARPVQATEPRRGDCPVCWQDVELNLAGRIRPHMFLLDKCFGAGSFPRTDALERRIHAKAPARLHWWKAPTCQICHAPLADDAGNPAWDITIDVTFICRNSCQER